MHFLPVRFDRILNVHRQSRWMGGPRTTFSFICDGEYTPYVTVNGEPELREGMEVVAVLRASGNWQTLAGWKDLATGELVFAGPKGSRSQFIKFIVSSVVVVAAMITMFGSSTAMGVVVVAGYGAWQHWKNWRQAERDAVALAQLGASAA